MLHFCTKNPVLSHGRELMIFGFNKVFSEISAN
jgi:hypothetical protein